MNSDQSALQVAPVLVAAALFFLSPLAAAEAGRVMYVSGEATLVRGGATPVTKGAAVEAGDLIRTGADGRVQLLMADGDRIALRPLTEFRIDEFSGPSRSKPGESVAGARPSSWRSFYTLAKGGFRTLTASLGERDPSSYQVRTPVATIGIRGTDYTVLYCTDDCAAYKTASLGVGVEGAHASVFREGAGSRLLFAALGTSWVADFVKAQTLGGGGSGDGGGTLYGGVSKGEISVDGPSGVKAVKDNEFFQATESGFGYLPDMPEGLQDQKSPEGESSYQEQVGETETAEGEAAEGETPDGQTAEGEAFSARTNPLEGDASGTTSGGGTTTTEGGGTFGTGPTASSSGENTAPAQTIGGTSPGGTPINLTGGTVPGSVGLATVASPTQAGYVSVGAVNLDGSGNVIGYQLPGGLAHAIGTAANTDLGSAQGMQWGRWTGGNAQIGGVSVNLSQDSIHWIHGPQVSSPSDVVLPTSGTATYELIGNSPPTDNHGNVGSAGSVSASFGANFLNQTVSSSIAFTLDDENWNASGSGSFANGGFNGTYGSGNCTSPSGGCTGNFAGFFTPGGSASAPPPGAGMTYSLDDGQGTTASGSAAFGNPTSP